MDNNTSGNKQNTDANSKISMLKGLRQRRDFSDRPVPDEVINDLLEVARWTGSGMNTQPWEFVLVRNTDALKEIARQENAGSHLAKAKFAIFILMEGTGNNIEAYDEGRLSERLLLAASAHGLDGGIWWVKDGGAAARSVLGIPAEKGVRSAISFGYPVEDDGTQPKRKDARKPLSELVHEEKY